MRKTLYSLVSSLLSISSLGVAEYFPECSVKGGSNVNTHVTDEEVRLRKAGSFVHIPQLEMGLLDLLGLTASCSGSSTLPFQ